MLDIETVHRRASRVLPEVVRTSGVRIEDPSEHGLAALLLPLRRKPSGVVAFTLSEATMRDLHDDALGFLHAATRARAGLGRFAEPFDYRPWRELELDCGMAYFTSQRDDRAWIVLLPAERLAIYGWRD